VAEIQLSVGLMENAEPPLHLQIADRARFLVTLGLPCVRIAEELSVSDKTVAKALRAPRSARSQDPGT
jgi:hypothetical protein